MAKKVVIIGAGPAGLTAGYELLKQDKNLDITILEESDEIGGIARTARHNGNRMDMGGHRFFSKDERVSKWWSEIFPCQGAPSIDDLTLNRDARLEEGGADPEKTDEVFLIRHRVSRIFYKGKFFDYPISMKPKTFINMGFITTLKAGGSYLYSCMHKLPEDNLENFYINRFGRVLYSMFFEGYTEKLWGRHPKEISADWGAQRVKGLSIWKLVTDFVGKLLPGKHEVETSLIEEFYYPKLGPGQLWEKVADQIEKMGGRVIKKETVSGFTVIDKKITGVKCTDGRNYDADIVISSMPLNNLVPALHVPDKEIAAIAKGLPYRDFVTVGLLVDHLAIKNKTKIKTLGNIVPDCWIYVQDTSVKLGRIQIFNNWSPYMLQNPEANVWLGLEYFCSENDSFWSMKESRCVNFAIEELKKIGIIDDTVKVLDSCRQRVKKAYPAYFDTYKDIDKLVEYLNGYENLYCVGRNGQHRYNNMDHSMATAFAAVDAIRGTGDKKEIWKVNTEKSYHESKNK